MHAIESKASRSILKPGLDAFKHAVADVHDRSWTTISRSTALQSCTSSCSHLQFGTKGASASCRTPKQLEDKNKKTYAAILLICQLYCHFKHCRLSGSSDLVAVVILPSGQTPWCSVGMLPDLWAGLCLSASEDHGGNTCRIHPIASPIYPESCTHLTSFLLTCRSRRCSLAILQAIIILATI